MVKGCCLHYSQAVPLLALNIDNDIQPDVQGMDDTDSKVLDMIKITFNGLLVLVLASEEKRAQAVKIGALF